MRRVFFHCCILLLFLVSAGCSSIRVRSDFDPEADFAAIRTYSWKMDRANDDALTANPLLYKRIVAAIDRYLHGRGYKQTAPEAADVYLNIQLRLKEKMRITEWGGPRGYFPDSVYDPALGYTYYGGRVDVSYYTEGTLVVDVVESKQDQLIWRGLGTGVFHEYSGQDKMEKTVDAYVREILDRFPPGYKEP